MDTGSYAKTSPIAIPGLGKSLLRNLDHASVQSRGLIYYKGCGYAERLAHHEAGRVVVGRLPRLPRRHPRLLRSIGSKLEEMSRQWHDPKHVVHHNQGSCVPGSVRNVNC